MILPILVGIQLTAAAAGLPLQLPAAPPAASVLIDDTDGPLSLETSLAPGTDLDLDTMTPGDSADWTITTLLDDDLTGSLTIRVVSSGELADHTDGARLLLRQCREPWAGRTCPAGAVIVVDAPLHTLDPATVHSAGSITAPRGPYFLATLSLPEDMPDTLQSSHLTFGLGFTASGDEESVSSSDLPDSPSDSLAETGSGAVAPLLATGLIALLTGLGVRLGSRTSTRSPPMRQRRIALLAATTGATLAAALLVPSSSASWTDSEWNHATTTTLSCSAMEDAATRGAGKLVGGSLAGIDLDDLAEARGVLVTHDGTSSTVSPSTADNPQEDTYANPLSVEALNAINLELTNLLVLPLNGETGVVNQYGQAKDTGESAGAAGAVADDGGIDLNPSKSAEPPQFATLELGEVLPQILGQSTGSGIANLTDARLEVGAVASNATLDSCDAAWQGSDYSALSRNYAVAGLDAELDSPLVGGLASTTDGTLTALETEVTRLAGSKGTVNQILGVLLGPNGLGPVLSALLINQDKAVTDLVLDVDLSAVRTLLTAPIQDAGRTLSIDLDTGTVTVDLATLLGPEYETSVGFNGLAPNTQLLLNADATNALTKALTEALEGWSRSVTQALDQALGLSEVEFHATVPAELLNGLGLPVEVATLRIDVGGTAPGQGVSLAALRAGQADVSITLARSGICSGTLGGTLCGVLGGVITALTSFPTKTLGPLIAGVLDPTLIPIAGNVAPNLQASSGLLVRFLSDALARLFGPNALLSIIVNAQNDPDPDQLPLNPAWIEDPSWPELGGTGQYDVAALRIQAAVGLLDLQLARSSVGPNSLP